MASVARVRWIGGVDGKGSLGGKGEVRCGAVGEGGVRVGGLGWVGVRWE